MKLEITIKSNGSVVLRAFAVKGRPLYLYQTADRLDLDYDPKSHAYIHAVFIRSGGKVCCVERSRRGPNAACGPYAKILDDRSVLNIGLASYAIESKTRAPRILIFGMLIGLIASVAMFALGYSSKDGRRLHRVERADLAGPTVSASEEAAPSVPSEGGLGSRANLLLVLDDDPNDPTARGKLGEMDRESSEVFEKLSDIYGQIDGVREMIAEARYSEARNLLRELKSEASGDSVPSALKDRIDGLMIEASMGESKSKKPFDEKFVSEANKLISVARARERLGGCVVAVDAYEDVVKFAGDETNGAREEAVAAIERCSRQKDLR